MILTQGLFDNRQGQFIELFSLSVFPQGLINKGQIINRGKDIGFVSIQRAFSQFKSAFRHFHPAGILPLLVKLLNISIQLFPGQFLGS